MAVAGTNMHTMTDPGCERCGRCLSVCPVYREKRIETFSPRGRLDLIRGVDAGEFTPGDRYGTVVHSCLQCLACFDACPKGVNAAGMIRAEKTRLVQQTGGTVIRLEALGLKLALGNRSIFARTAAVLNALSGRFKKRRNAVAPSRHLPLFLLDALAGKQIPDLHRDHRADRLPSIIDPPAGKTPRGEVILFTGCFFGYLDTRPLAAAIRALMHNAVRIHIPSAQVCCGAPAALSGHPGILAKNSRINLKAFGDDLPVVTLCATCGSTLKHDYQALFQTDAIHDRRARTLPERVVDLDEYLSGLTGFRPGPVPIHQHVTIHQPCHLNRGMSAGGSIRALLEKLPGLGITTLEGEAECCGGGGLCAVKNPDLSRSLGSRKAGRITDTGADLIAAPCPGCLLQIRDRLSALDSGIKPVHPAELVARTYGYPL